jgi:hypothetical protein
MANGIDGRTGTVKAKTILGIPCLHGHTGRYASNGNCVECEKARSARQVWKPEYNATRRAKRNPRKKTETYHGQPCPKRHTLRYRSNGGCVECSKARKDSYTKEQRRNYNREWKKTRRLLGLPVH